MKTNGTMMQYFHWYYGNTSEDPDLWETVRGEAAHLAELGITALWLPPAFKSESVESVGYDIYDLYDLGEFDQKGSVRTKYGTKHQYLDAIITAQDRGIDVYADVVFNHKAGADDTEWVRSAKVAWNDRNFVIENEVWVEAWTKFNFEGRRGNYSDFKWCYRHFDGVDYAQNLGENAIFKFLDPGKDWAKMVSGENGNYDYLMFSDIDMNHPEVRTELARWGKWFLETTGVNGFRLDAIKHIQFSFFRDWLEYLRRDHPDLFAVGEYWSPNLEELNNYLEKTRGCMSLFDAPLQNNFFNASRPQNGGFDMRKILDNTLVKCNPLKAVTLVDNHDTQPCQSLEHWVDWWFKPLAYAIILLRQDGYPCVFYPDLYGAKYEDYKKGYKIDLAPVPRLEELIRARKCFAYGMQRDYFDDAYTIGWTREGDFEHPSGLAVVLSNGPAAKKWMEVGRQNAGKCYVDHLSNYAGEVFVNGDGWGEFPVSEHSVSAWVEKTS